MKLMHSILPLLKRRFIAKTIVLLFLITTSSVSFSQIHTSIDFVSGVDFTRMSGITEISPGSNLASFQIDEKINYRVGANFNFRIFEKMLIKTGLRYVQIGFKENFNLPNDYQFGWINANGNQINTVNTGDIFSVMQDPKYNAYDQKFIEIPLISRIELSDKKLALFLEIGISPHIKLSSRNKQISALGKETIDENVEIFGSKKMLVALIFGIGLNYNVSDNYQFFAQPTIRCYCSDSDKGRYRNAIENIGVEIGVRRVLKRY